MNIIFMGTPDFARDSLEAIYNKGHNIQAVVTNPDKPKGRGMKLISSPVKEFAIEKGLKIYQPEKVRNNEEFINEIKSYNPDVLCVVAYGKILPKEVLDIPKYGAINVHGSLLPKYRGAAPIQWAVINGEKETGITTIFMDEGMDSGDIILKERTEIDSNETTGMLWNRLSKIGANLLVKTLNEIEDASKKIQSNNSEEIKNEIKIIVGAQKQEDDFTLAPMLDKEMSKIDWNKSALEIKNLIRGLDPIMGTYTFYKGEKIKIWSAEIDDNSINFENSKPGEIVIADIKNGLHIKTGNGVLSIIEIQGLNSKRMDIKSYLNGNEITVGEFFE